MFEPLLQELVDAVLEDVSLFNRTDRLVTVLRDAQVALKPRSFEWYLDGSRVICVDVSRDISAHNDERTHGCEGPGGDCQLFLAFELPIQQRQDKGPRPTSVTAGYLRILCEAIDPLTLPPLTRAAFSASMFTGD